MSDVVLVGSDRCGLDDLILDFGTEAERGRLGLGTGWSRRWTGTWRTSGGDVACAVRDLGEVPAPARAGTVRIFFAAIWMTPRQVTIDDRSTLPQGARPAGEDR